MNTVVVEVARIVGRLEEVAAGYNSADSARLNEMVKALTKAVEHEIENSSFSKHVTSFLLRSGKESGVGLGQPLFREIRELLFPGANMTSIVFEPTSRIHHAAFFIHEGDQSEFARALCSANGLGIDTVILPETDIPESHRLLLKEIRSRAACYDSEEALKSIAEKLAGDFNCNVTQLTAEGYAAAIATASTSRIFGEARYLPLFSASSFPPAEKDGTIGFHHARIWTLKTENAMISELPSPPVACSPVMLWWLIYIFKCALNLGEYCVFWANPSNLDPSSRSGVVVTTKVRGLSPEGAISLAAAVNQLAGGILTILDRLGALDLNRERLRALNSAQRADLAATFSHAYVKQAANFTARASDLARDLTRTGATQAGDASKSAADAKRLAKEIGIYSDDMTLFAEFAKGTVWFEPKDSEASECAFLVAHIVRALSLAVVVAESNYMEWFNKAHRSQLIRLAHDVLLGTTSDDDPGSSSLSGWMADFAVLLEMGGVSLKYAPEHVAMVRIVPPIEPEEAKLRTVTQKELFDKALEKLLFEVFLNGFRNWSDAALHQPELLANSSPYFSINLPSPGNRALHFVSTSYFPVSGRVASQDEYRGFYSYYRTERNPEHPVARGGTGGWGLFGNHLLSTMFRDRDVRGSFHVKGKFPPEVSERISTPYVFDFESILRLPRAFLSIATK
jgi:hypothetical protein